jgi:hypothetical protein
MTDRWEIDIDAMGHGVVKRNGEPVDRVIDIQIRAGAGRVTEVEVTRYALDGVRSSFEAEGHVFEQCPSCGTRWEYEPCVDMDQAVNDLGASQSPDAAQVVGPTSKAQE